MKYNLIGVAVALLLAGCQTTIQGAGSGDINFSREVDIRFQGYLANPGGEYFVVSVDGQHWGYSVCAAGRYGCTEGGGTVALRACHSTSEGVPCKIYAVGEDIVWQGVEKSRSTRAKVSTEIGSGPIEFSPTTRLNFQKYLDLAYPEYFAVSTSGQFF